jgi:hypothetical protein
MDRSGMKSYKVTGTSPGGPVVLTGFLIRIGEARATTCCLGGPLAAFARASVNLTGAHVFEDSGEDGDPVVIFIPAWSPCECSLVVQASACGEGGDRV